VVEKEEIQSTGFLSSVKKTRLYAGKQAG